MSGVDRRLLLELMLTSRALEEREAVLVRQGKSWSQIPCAGHEATMAVVHQLRRSDYLFTYYRGYHLRVAKRIPVAQIAKDFFARASSSSGGRSVSVHCSSRELNVFPDAAPTASQCLPAVGVAWGQKLSGRDDITLCSIGDGSTRQGEFYEAICFAVQERLPIVFLVEDNGYAISTRTDAMSPLRLEIFNAARIRTVDGHDVDEVHEAGRRVIEAARAGHGPSVLWCHVARLGPHTMAEDQARYRSAAELAKLVDPIDVLAHRMISQGETTRDKLDELRASVQANVAGIYKRVELEEPQPDPSTVYRHVTVDKPPPAQPAIDPPAIPPTMLSAITGVLRKGLSTFSNLVLFGQDIEDPKGGVFGLTHGLSKDFPGRVINAPLAEATMIGGAIGLSISGYKPVCELQFIDFMTPGFNQLVSHVSTLRWRSMGSWSCPMVLYAPYGAYLPSGGLWHSQSNDAWWAHMPGLQVAIPSRPDDAAALFWTAMHDDNPSLILLPKHLLRVPQPDCEVEVVPFGKGRICRTGTDVTLVTWGNCVEIAMQAAEQVAASVEIIDLRTLVPCDWALVERSLRKTGRLAVVHEDSYTCGFGAQVVAEMVTQVERFSALWMAPQIVARRDVPMPYHPDLEREVLPSVASVIAAISRACADL